MGTERKMREKIESYVEFGDKDTAIVLNRKALNYGQLVVRASVDGHKGLFLVVCNRERYKDK